MLTEVFNVISNDFHGFMAGIASAAAIALAMRHWNKVTGATAIEENKTFIDSEALVHQMIIDAVRADPALDSIIVEGGNRVYVWDKNAAAAKGSLANEIVYFDLNDEIGRRAWWQAQSDLNDPGAVYEWAWDPKTKLNEMANPETEQEKWNRPKYATSKGIEINAAMIKAAGSLAAAKGEIFNNMSDDNHLALRWVDPKSEKAHILVKSLSTEGGELLAQFREEQKKSLIRQIDPRALVNALVTAIRKDHYEEAQKSADKKIAPTAEDEKREEIAGKRLEEHKEELRTACREELMSFSWKTSSSAQVPYARSPLPKACGQFVLSLG